jgi:hypothetical protein
MEQIKEVKLQQVFYKTAQSVFLEVFTRFVLWPSFLPRSQSILVFWNNAVKKARESTLGIDKGQFKFSSKPKTILFNKLLINQAAN